MGLCPKPHILFCLETKKYAKKFKTPPASLEKLALVRLKSSKLIPTKYVGTQTRTIFNRLPHLFFGSPDEVNPVRVYSDFYLEKLLYFYFFFFTAVTFAYNPQTPSALEPNVYD